MGTRPTIFFVILMKVLAAKSHDFRKNHLRLTHPDYAPDSPTHGRALNEEL
jgi:hypothetical protein